MISHLNNITLYFLGSDFQIYTEGLDEFEDLVYQNAEIKILTSDDGDEYWEVSSEGGMVKHWTN